MLLTCCSRATLVWTSRPWVIEPRCSESSLLSSPLVPSPHVPSFVPKSTRYVESSRDARASGEVIRRNEYPMVLTSQYNRLGELQTRPQAYRAPNIPAIMTAPRREFQRWPLHVIIKDRWSCNLQLDEKLILLASLEDTAISLVSSQEIAR